MVDETKATIEELTTKEFPECKAEIRIDDLVIPPVINVFMRRGQLITVSPSLRCKAEFLYQFMVETYKEIGRLTVLGRHIRTLLSDENK